MKRIPQIIHVIVQEKGDWMLGKCPTINTTDDVKLRALELAGMTPHPKYFKRVMHFTQPHPFPKGQRVWNATVVRP